MLAVAARKRRSAERPDQTVAGPRRRKQVEVACAAACEPLPAWARCEDQPKGWDFVLNEILPSLVERSAFAKGDLRGRRRGHDGARSRQWHRQGRAPSPPARAPAVRSRAAQERRGRRPALARGGWVGGALAGWEYRYAAGPC